MKNVLTLVLLVWAGIAHADDTALVQAAINASTPLEARTYTISRTLTVEPGQALLGQGNPGTLLQATDALIGGDLVLMTSPHESWARPVVRGVAILGSPGGTNHIGLWASGPPGDGPTVDRYRISEVWISGRFVLAFACTNVASSLMDFVQIWNYQPNTFAAAWLTCSDWTNTQVEVHQNAPSPPGGATWSWYGSGAIRFFGGNMSLHGAGQHIVGPGVQLYGTTLYHEP